MTSSDDKTKDNWQTIQMMPAEGLEAWYQNGDSPTWYSKPVIMWLLQEDRAKMPYRTQVVAGVWKGALVVPATSYGAGGIYCGGLSSIQSVTDHEIWEERFSAKANRIASMMERFLAELKAASPKPILYQTIQTLLKDLKDRDDAADYELHLASEYLEHRGDVKCVGLTYSLAEDDD
jgi:hypothetical protein